MAFLFFLSANAGEGSGQYAATLYGARISEERTWQHVLRNPFSVDYANAYLVAGALSREYGSYRGGALRLEMEGNIAYNFGDQDHFEFNAAPVVLRWRKFPWNEHVATTAAFGLGLSYATEIPEVEVALEKESQRLLVFWMLELTAGPVDAPWSIAVRLHHRSPAWGLMGIREGGVNAVGIGVRYELGDL